MAAKGPLVAPSLSRLAALVLFAPIALFTAGGGPAAATTQTTATCAAALRDAAAAHETPNTTKPFILVTAVNGYRELLSASAPAGASIDSMRLLPASSESAPVKCWSIRLDDTEGISLRGAYCAPIDRAHVDVGPTARFSGTARGQYSAAIRVLVEESGSAPKSTIDDSVEFSVDGGPSVTMPARGVEPVSVTSIFQYLADGPHRIAYTAFQGRDAHDAPSQGVVCI
jgi:hypothetical protein